MAFPLSSPFDPPSQTTHHPPHKGEKRPQKSESLSDYGMPLSLFLISNQSKRGKEEALRVVKGWEKATRSELDGGSNNRTDSPSPVGGCEGWPLQTEEPTCHLHAIRVVITGMKSGKLIKKLKRSWSGGGQVRGRKWKCEQREIVLELKHICGQ